MTILTGGTNRLIAGASILALGTAILGVPGIARAADQPAPIAVEDPLRPPTRSVTMSVPLVWAGRVLSDVIVQIDPDGSIAIESQSLRSELSRLLTEPGIVRLDETIAGDPFVTTSELQIAGFDVSFDMARLELTVNAIDPTLRPIEPLRGRSQNSERLLPSAQPANFSAYLNTSVNFI